MKTKKTRNFQTLKKVCKNIKDQIHVSSNSQTFIFNQQIAEPHNVPHGARSHIPAAPLCRVVDYHTYAFNYECV